MNRLRLLSITAAAASVALLSTSADAGWGSRSSYGSYGSAYGSSGYSADYGSGGSSGYASYSSYASSGSSGGSYGSSYASHGSSGGSYASSYASHGSSGGSQSSRVGLLGRLAQHLHAHKAKRHSRHRHQSSGGSSGYSSYYSSGGSSGYSSYYGSGGSSGSSSYYGSYGGGSSGGGVYSSGSAPYYGTTPYYSAGYKAAGTRGSYNASSVFAASEASSEETSIADDTALLTIAVPESARVIVNGHQTTSTGPIRQFMSKGLKSGYTYTYEVEVQSDVDGQIVSDQQTVVVRAGQAERLAFDLPAAAEVETVVTVNVPADAEVTLAGNPTGAKGETRTFRTRQLKAGETWDNYSVEVAVMLDGRRVVQEKSISLRAGSEEELTFDFDSSANAVVAAR